MPLPIAMFVRPADGATHPGARMPQIMAGHADYVPFDNMESRNGLQERIEIPLLLYALGLPAGGRVLEVGCGRGIALPVLAERLRPTALVGVDIDPFLVECARQRIMHTRTRAEVHAADVRALPFESASFDVVIDFGTCYHVSGGPTGRLAALNEISRVLCAGGLFVHETRVAQHLAHPVRSLGRRLPWTAVPTLVPERSALLWTVRRRVGPRARHHAAVSGTFSERDQAVHNAATWAVRSTVQ
jgi:SAM-dependent methyltransferase